MQFELIRIGIAVALTSVAAWQDSKTSYVDDWVLYAMVASGLVLNALAFDLPFFLSTLPFAVLIAIAGFILWRRGSFGQGDVWLFLGLQLLLPAYPSFVKISLPNFPFAASVFLAASFFSVVGAGVFYFYSLCREEKNFVKSNALKLGVLVMVSVALAVFLSSVGVGVFAKAFFLVFAVAALFFALFYVEIKEKILVKWLSPKQIEDEDVLVVERVPPEIVEKYSLGRVITKREFEKLELIVKSGKMRKFPVLKNLIRFNPYVLLGLLACLYAGDLMLWVLLR